MVAARGKLVHAAPCFQRLKSEPGFRSIEEGMRRHTAPPAGTLALGRPGGRGGRRVRQQIGKQIGTWLHLGNGRRGQRDQGLAQHPQVKAFDLRRGLRLLGVLLGGAFADNQADSAGMLAIKRFPQRFANARFPRKCHRHANPRHRLQHDPLQSQAQRKGQNNRHVREFSHDATAEFYVRPAHRVVKPVQSALPFRRALLLSLAGTRH